MIRYNPKLNPLLSRQMMTHGANISTTRAGSQKLIGVDEARSQRFDTVSDVQRGNKAVGQPSFADALERAVQAVDAKQHQADDKLAAMASGEDVDIHGTMIALQEADISLRAMTSVRDKVIDAYKDIMNMAI